MKIDYLIDNDTGVTHFINRRIDGYPVVACGHQPNRYSCHSRASDLEIFFLHKTLCHQCLTWSKRRPMDSKEMSDIERKINESLKNLLMTTSNLSNKAKTFELKANIIICISIAILILKILAVVIE